MRSTLKGSCFALAIAFMGQAASAEIPQFFDKVAKSGDQILECSHQISILLLKSSDRRLSYKIGSMQTENSGLSLGAELWASERIDGVRYTEFHGGNGVGRHVSVSIPSEKLDTQSSGPFEIFVSQVGLGPDGQITESIMAVDRPVVCTSEKVK